MVVSTRCLKGRFMASGTMRKLKCGHAAIRIRCIAIAATILFGMVYLPSVVSACPTCKYALVGNRDLAFAISVLFMMSVPFILLTAWFVAIWRLRARADQPSLDS
jgi:hypothetical protein